MNCFRVKIADTVFAVHNRYPDVIRFCKDYLTTEKPVFEITQSDESLAQEMVRMAFGDHQTTFISGPEPAEINGIFRQIAEYFSNHQAAVLYGTLLERFGEGYLFTAESGTGKTTHARNWCAEYPDTRIVNGDKPILRIVGDRVLGYGSPWCGKERYNVNKSVPVKAIILLERGKENRIEPIGFGDALPALVAQTYTGEDETGVPRTVELVTNLKNRVAFYRLTCNMDQSSARVAWEGMNPAKPK